MTDMNPGIDQLLDQFEEALKGEEASALTIKNYRLDLAHFRKWFESTNGEVLTVGAITPTDVREYKGYLQTVEQRSPATVNRRLAGLRKLCRWAKAQGLIADDPTERIKGVERVKTAPKSLDRSQLKALIRRVEKAGDKLDMAIVQVLRHTGIRVGELANVRLADVVLGERKGSVTIRQGKGNKWREVPFNADVRRALREYLEERKKQQAKLAKEDDHLFLGQRGRMTAAGIQDVVEKYARLANLEGVSPHKLRHTFGKSLLDSGVDLVTVASLLGHSRLDTTAVYTQPSRVDQERAVEKIAESEA
jgi:integrase/recombinase XerC